MDQEKIGKFIAKLRKDKNMTQEELAEKLNVSSKSVSRWENGKCMPDFSLLVPLSKELGMSVNDLLSGEKVDKKDYQETFEKNIFNIVTKVEVVNKRFKIFFKLLLILLILIPIICTVFFFIDYNRIKNGKEPKFSKAISTQFINICDPAKEDNCFSTTKVPEISTIYSGFGYKIVTCNYCEKSIYAMPLNIGTYPYEYLTCTDNQYTYQYSFMDGKVKSISTTLIIPFKEIINKETYENEMEKLNTIKGCYGSFSKNYDLNYSLNKSCDLAKMSIKNIESEYGLDSYILYLTRKELTKLHKNSNKNMKCQLHR